MKIFSYFKTNSFSSLNMIWINCSSCGPNEENWNHRLFLLSYQCIHLQKHSQLISSLLRRWSRCLHVFFFSGISRHNNKTRYFCSCCICCYSWSCISIRSNDHRRINRTQQPLTILPKLVFCPYMFQ